MFETDRIVALDIGASKIVVAEFSTTKAGAPEMLNYGVGQLGVDPDSETDTTGYILTTIRQVMRENGIKPARLFMTVSGQAVFPRYVKLPPVSRDKVMQMIQYEAEQNVPFPIAEVVWDYQLIGGTGEGEQNVMLVAVKIESIKALTDTVQAAGLEPEIVDVAPMALYNAVRYNYPDLQGCTMVLAIGARSSNLIFVEEERVFSRSIPVAGNAITQELAKEFEVPFKEAEELKRTHGFVAFGGVYAGPESDVADRVSKVIRNVVTRLHAEVNRSINFYRSQQGGNPPSLVLLAGGSSVIPHTDTFFRERLKVEVEHLNPFTNVAVNERIDTETVERDIHLLGEVTGLGLRHALSCPVEVNLMPPDLVARKVFRKRQPFFALAAAGLVLVLLCWWVYSHRMREMRGEQLKKVEARIGDLRSVSERLDEAARTKKKAAERVDSLLHVASLRTKWVEILDAIHASMFDGMWLTALAPVTDKNGRIKQIEVHGVGFEDKLKTGDTADATAVEIFRDRLRSSELFGEGTEIKRQPPMSDDAFAREFEVWVTLEEPIEAR